MTRPNRFNGFLPGIAVFLATLTPLGAGETASRDQLPLGHPDFYPSPARPVGWRGDGNGAFPGATTVDAFREGPVKTVEFDFWEMGKQINRTVRKPVVDHDGQATNIAWKSSLPGFTQSQPIVVGDRAIQTCEPRTVLCIDMKTGKEIWRQELDPFKMIGLDDKAREEALLLESTAWTLHALSKNRISNYSRLYGADTPENRVKWLAQFARMRTVLDKAASTFPEETKTALAGIEAAEAVLRDAKLELGKSASKDKNRAVVVRGFARANSPFNKLFHQRYKFYATMHWYTYIGWTWPTPVCDGTWLYVHMNQGQVARLSLADGSIDWFRRLAEFGTDWDLYSKQPTPRSPLLHKGVMIISTSPGLFGLDGRTGREFWRHELPKLTNVTALGPTLMHLSSGRTVLASYTRANETIILLDPASGKVLGTIPVKKGAHDPGPSLMSEGDILIASHSAQAFRVIEEGDTLSAKELWPRKKGHGGNTEVLHDGVFYGSNGKIAIDGGEVMNTGRVQKGGPFSLGTWKPGILIGDRIVGAARPLMSKPYLADGMYRLGMNFPVVGLDGKIISKENYLEITSKTKGSGCVPQAARFLGKNLTGDHLENQCAGLPQNFSYAGLYAHGNRLLIPSHTHLYCIGDPKQPYNGKAGPAK